MVDVDAAFIQKVLHIPKRQREPDLHHHRQADDFKRRPEVSERVGLLPTSQRGEISGRQAASSDNAAAAAQAATLRSFASALFSIRFQIFEIHVEVVEPHAGDHRCDELDPEPVALARIKEREHVRED